jgi:hypothetical protein
MRAIIDVGLYVLAVGSIVQAGKVHGRQHADLLKDLNTISSYWGASNNKETLDLLGHR